MLWQDAETDPASEYGRNQFQRIATFSFFVVALHAAKSCACQNKTGEAGGAAADSSTIEPVVVPARRKVIGDHTALCASRHRSQIRLPCCF